MATFCAAVSRSSWRTPATTLARLARADSAFAFASSSEAVISGLDSTAITSPLRTGCSGFTDREASRAEMSGAMRISVSCATPMSGGVDLRCFSNRNRAAAPPRITTASPRIAKVLALLRMASLAA